MSEWTVPVVDPETVDGHDEVVDAETAQDAVRQIGDEYHIAFSFAEEHFDVDRGALLTNITDFPAPADDE